MQLLGEPEASGGGGGDGGGGGTSGLLALSKIDTTAFVANIACHYKFEGNLNDEGPQGMHLTSSGSTIQYVPRYGIQFCLMDEDAVCQSAAYNALPDIIGEATFHIVADIQPNTIDSAIFLFGVPGTNSPGTNYRWAFMYREFSKTIEYWHEYGGGLKQWGSFACSIPGGVHHLAFVRGNEIGVTGTQNLSMYLDGELITTLVLPTIPGGTSASQVVHVGGAPMQISEALTVIADQSSIMKSITQGIGLAA